MCVSVCVFDVFMCVFVCIVFMCVNETESRTFHSSPQPFAQTDIRPWGHEVFVCFSVQEYDTDQRWRCHPARVLYNAPPDRQLGGTSSIVPSCAGLPWPDAVRLPHSSLWMSPSEAQPAGHDHLFRAGPDTLSELTSTLYLNEWMAIYFLNASTNKQMIHKHQGQSLETLSCTMLNKIGQEQMKTRTRVL